MSEAKQLHRDLMNALLPILPRKVYGDIRRVLLSVSWSWILYEAQQASSAEAEEAPSPRT